MIVNTSAILYNCGIIAGEINAVSGGDTNQCYHIHTHNAQYFLKVNDADSMPAMLQKEADALAMLQGRCPLRIPNVIQAGTVEQNQFLLLEWMQPAKRNALPTSWQFLGEGLAQLHRHTQKSFGLTEDNYIGSMPQLNRPCSTWKEFYADYRLIPLAKHLYDQQQIIRPVITSLESICNRLDDWFPKEPPALLHGDFWSGNCMMLQDGSASIFDPAVYYGHREMDIGMSALFGGFHAAFYEAYNHAYPLQPGWQERISLAQLYPILVHASLFGGHYISSAVQIIDRLC